MATTRPFAYNTGSTISATTQVGDLAVGTNDLPVSEGYGGLTWKNGPDEDLGYVIGYPQSGGTQPLPVSGTGFVQFWRSKIPGDDTSFINLAEYISRKYSTPQTFANANDAKIWLNSNGFWTSYEPIPTPTPSPTPVPLRLYLDSGNPSSYPGTGTTWFDLSTLGNNATLINNPLYSSNYQGILNFEDLDLEYSTAPNLNDLNQWTVETWFRLTSPLTGKVTSIVSNQYNLTDKLNFSIGTNNAPSNYNLAVGFFDTNGWHTTNGFVPQTNVWYQVVGTYDGSILRQYVNGSASGGTLSYVGTPQSGGEVRLMRRWDSPLTTGNLVNGDLAIVKIYNTALSSGDILSSYNSTYNRFLDVTPTPTATNLPPTPTQTPTNTPTPSTSPLPVTGFSFNLVATPYTWPSAGNSIMNSAGGITTGSTQINLLATGGRGFYFNSFDNDGIDRTSYFSAFTGQSVTITFNQTGTTAIYSGDTNSFKSWVQSPQGSGFVFGANVPVPGGSPSGVAIIIQSATTNYTIGFPVYVSLVVN